MKGASWAAGTISTAPDVEVCNSQQQTREKNEKKDRIPCHFQPVGVLRTSRTHARAKMRRHVDADLCLSLTLLLNIRYLLASAPRGSVLSPGLCIPDWNLCDLPLPRSSLSHTQVICAHDGA